MSPLADAEEESSKWLLSERSQMIRAIKDLIEEARRMSRSQRTPARERLKWTRLTGQLILYKDSILKNVLLEVLQKEVEALKQAAESQNEPSQAPTPGIILGPNITASGSNQKSRLTREPPSL